MSLPLACSGLLAPLGTCCMAGCVSLFTSTAASALFRPCNCQSSIATRVGYAVLFCLDALLAWVSLTPAFVHTVESWSFNYIQMDCTRKENCFGVVAVHRITFALALFHLLLASMLVGVHDTRSRRASIQNGWWGSKLLALGVLVALTFLIPNPFFVFWANWVAPLLAGVFILLGLVLLVDVAHTWSETCLYNWERFDAELWKYLLVGSTLGLYALVLVVIVLLYVYFAPAGCSANQAFVSVNLALSIALTVLSVHPVVQEANPRSGLAQSSMVLAYCTYLLTSALMNRDDRLCNPIARGRGETTKTTTVVVGALFTFGAIAYSTSRAATQSAALVGTQARGEQSVVPPAGYGPLATDETPVVTQQPSGRDSLRIEAIRAAVDAGSIPASALEAELRGRRAQTDEEEEDDTPPVEDDERGGAKYNYTFFHLIFAIAACYTAMLLTDWRWVKLTAPGPDEDPAPPVVYIGTSVTAMWIRIVSSWLCAALYDWTLIAPVVMPDRFAD